MKRLYPILSALLLLAACAESDTDRAVTQQLQNSPDFHATFESDDTRTFVDEKVRLLWTEGDLISIFTNTLNQKYKFDGETGDNSGTFTPISSGQFGSGSSLSVDANYAVYPYNQSTKISYDGELLIDLPATQFYAEDSFGVNANTMVAVTQSQNDNFLSFKNLGGFLKLQLYGDVTVKSIHLEGNNGEKIAGGATVTAKYGKNPTLTMDSDATTSITLDCGAGVKLSASSSSATEFWLVVPPVTFSKGFTITITDTEGGTMTKSTSKSYTVERNVMKSMTAFEVETEQPVQILYTSTDGSVIIPNTTTFGSAKIVSNVYENGQGVITFNRTITSVPNNAFKSQTKLVTISLPESVTSIGDYAFSDCTRMTTISASGTTSVGQYAFYNCAKLVDISFPNLKTIYGYAFHKCVGLTTVNLPNVTTIRASAFSGCTNMTSIKFPKLSGVIRTNAFCNCSSLKSVIIPNDVTAMERYAFDGCSSLESITIGNSVKSIYESAFTDCKALKSVHISDIETWCNINFYNGSSNPMTHGAKLYLDDILVEDIVIPNGIEKIKDYVFKGCISINKVTIPESVSEIGEYAFFSCSNLTNINIPNSITKIGQYAFCDCASLISIELSDRIVEISKCTFDNCSSLKSITIPDSIIAIREWAFSGCTSLQQITIPNSVTQIGQFAFMDCTSLTSIVIPNSVISIEDNPFIGCGSLSTFYGKYASSDNRCLIVDGVLCSFAQKDLDSYILPDNVKKIGGYSFRKCNYLTSVTIPSNTTEIGGNAFSFCESLKSVYCKPITPPSLHTNVFADNASGRRFYVPTESVESYKAADGWKSYASSIVGYDFE